MCDMCNIELSARNYTNIYERYTRIPLGLFFIPPLSYSIEKDINKLFNKQTCLFNNKIIRCLPDISRNFE